MPGQVIGTIGQEEVRLENAATESTLELLVETMNDVAKKLGVKGKDYTKELKHLKEEAKARKDLKDTLEDEESKRRDLNKELDTQKKKFKENLQDWDNVFRTVSKGFESIFSGTTPTIAGFARMFDGLPLVGPIISGFGAVLGQQVDVFRSLSSQGIQLGDSLFGAAQAAAKMGVPLDTLSNVLKNNSANLALFAGSAKTGADRFINISTKMKASGFGEKMMRLGYSMEDMAEHTAGYLEIQTKLGRSQKMSDAELAAGTQEYLLQLDELSRATGMSRKEAEASLKSLSDDKRLKSLLSNMSEPAKKALQGVTAMLDKASPEMSEGIKELVATGGIPVSDFGKALARNNPQLAENARRLRDGTISQEEFVKSINQAANRSGQLTKEEEKLHAQLVARNKYSPYADRVALQSLKNFGAALTDAQKEQQRAMENEKLAAAGIDQALTKIRAAFYEGFIETGILDQFATGLAAVVGGLGKFLNDLSKFDLSTALANLFDPTGAIERDDAGKPILDKQGQEIRKSSRSLFELASLPLADGIKDLFTNSNTYLVLGGAITALFAGAVVKKALVGAFSSLTSGVADKLTGGLAGKAAGKGAATIGAGAGKGADKALSGLGSGLAKLANPKSLLGIAALAGIGASMFIAAKAFQEFAKIPWDAIGKGFVTLLGLGAVAAVLGVASPLIISGSLAIGAMGIALLPFAAAATVAAPALDQIVTSLQGLEGVPIGDMLLLGPALFGIGAGMAALSAGGLITTIVDGFGKLFGAKSPMEKLAELGKSAPNIVQLADALKALDFTKLDASKTNFDSFTIGASKVNELTASLERANVQMKEMSKTSLTEDVKTVIAQVGNTITSAITPPADKSKPGVDRQITLLSDLGMKLDKLNMSMAELVNIQSDVAPDVKKTAGNTKLASGKMY